MPIFADSKQDIFSDILNDIYNNSNIRERSPGSNTRALAEAVANKIEDVWDKFDANMAHAFLDGAQGRYLDYFGEMFGLSRIGEKAAIVGPNDDIIKFSRASGGSTVVIPQGTIVSTLANEQGVSYITTAEVSLTGAALSVYAPARSRLSGVRGNIGKGALTHHNADASLSVTNETSILTGNGLESDENFRFRISKQVFSAETGNFTAIRIACLSVPGVADVVIIPFFRGVGTFEVLVKSISPSVSETLLENVRRNLYFTVAQGVSFNVRKPIEIGISMEIDVYLKEPTTDALKEGLRNAIKETVYGYIDNLDIGEEMIINEIVQRVMAIDDNIKTLGKSKSTGLVPITKIYAHKESTLINGSQNEEIIKDYLPAVDEKLLIELLNPIGGDPVKVNIHNPS